MVDDVLARIETTADRWRHCAGCRRWWPRRALAPRWTCPGCAAPFRMSAVDRIGFLVDAGTFQEHEAALTPGDPLDFRDRIPYPLRHARTRERTGLREAALLGTAAIAGRRVVLVVFDFDFLGGSMGVVVGEKVARGAEIALHERVPLLTVSASGGGRMQEGAFALVQGAKTAAAIGALREAGVPYLSVLTDPVIGGVQVSFASAGDVVLAEEGTRAGFAGRRVIEQTTGRTLPADFQTAAFLLRHGHVDLVVPRHELPGCLGRLVAYATRAAAREPTGGTGAPASLARPVEAVDPWDAVLAVRAAHRPRLAHYLDTVFTDVLELHGDRLRADDPTIFTGLARLAGDPVVVIGHNRVTDGSRPRNGGMALPAGYRKATRAMTLAERWSIPVVTLVDTPGAHPDAEADNQSAAIAETMLTAARLATPVLCAVIGEGGSGGALALAIGDRLLMQQNATFSVISPEGCAAILFSDSAKAPEAARALHLRATDLHRHGLIDEVVDEPPGGAHTAPALAGELLAAALRRHLAELRGQSGPALVTRRSRRLRALGRAWCRHGDVATDAGRATDATGRNGVHSG
ncbi:carboxyl transferase domain-containing protein [Actinosynnema sp. CS-041913]|uniref:carboxyl transferase domain-containing protein n=1 Tax=Actinosynnema sp. CS-041913 TaxID=3239917 RepID=UPI003D9375A6